MFARAWYASIIIRVLKRPDEYPSDIDFRGQPDKRRAAVKQISYW